MQKLIIIFFFIFLAACHTNKNKAPKNIERGIYYWKSTYNISTIEQQYIDTLHVQHLYIKFFDVSWNSQTNVPLPIAQIRCNDGTALAKNNLHIIPTIFITNECIAKLQVHQINNLAKNILQFTKKISTNYGLHTFNELQIDCDWTATTKQKYFNLLTSLQQLDTALQLSATIRLHQIKFAAKTGVPPVQRGMLMCYNLGNLTNVNTQNSIIEINELQKYIADLHNYTLPLDVALPIFNWKVLFTNNKYKGLIENLPTDALSPNLFNKNRNFYTSKFDTVVNGYSFNKNDIVRDEQSDYNDIIEAANLVTNKITNNNIRVSLFHLDTVTLKKYSYHEIENIYNAMR